MTTDDERSSVERREVEDRFEMPAPTIRRRWRCDDCDAYGEGENPHLVEDRGVDHGQAYRHHVTFWWTDQPVPPPYQPEPEPVTTWAYQLLRCLGGWDDLATFSDYNVAIRCGIDTVPGKVRLVRRTTTEVVLP